MTKDKPRLGNKSAASHRGAFKKKTLFSTMSVPGTEGSGLRYLTLS
ncbi:hypothetical protein CfE428DRAFT_6559 [Chthoniobacter flavus Ellin428]|uniref:Uncharacterized protein n=1 Tax=Chthoniobacter flavus Ellin428 TaxID=497964 RepID=B4DCB8_9BACT|nr:hypothetical protein CfE428DRAFT_6559 [Chthoniobacter flavus Ellin428]